MGLLGDERGFEEVSVETWRDRAELGVAVEDDIEDGRQGGEHEAEQRKVQNRQNHDGDREDKMGRNHPGAKYEGQHSWNGPQEIQRAKPHPG